MNKFSTETSDKKTVKKKLPPEIVQWVKECKRGKHIYFGMLYQAYVKDIARMIKRRTNHHVYEGLTQEVFIIAFRKIHQAKPEKFRSWLYSIANSKIKTYYKTKSKEKEKHDNYRAHVLYSQSNSCNVSNEKSIILKKRLEIVFKSLDQLPHHQREILELRINGVSGSEIARIINIKEGSVNTNVHHARKNLKKFFYKKAIEKLTGLEAQIATMRILKEKNPEEISEKLGFSIEDVNATWSNAKEKVKNYLNDELGCSFSKGLPL